MSYADAASPRDARFEDLHPSLTKQAALAEADRCLYCFDAPCMQACPTHIDVPAFIRRIAQGNLIGSARTILDANILGASCARACPVEVLCEGACVLHHDGKQPIRIGLLQRHAMEALHGPKLPLPFTPGTGNGRRVALLGAGPASLACAAELRRHGIAADLYDARPLPGGLNTYGIAEYKLPFGVALHEVQMLADLGATIHSNTPVDAAMLRQLAQDYDAVFLGIGLGAIRRLGIPGEELHGVLDALELIAGYKSGAITKAPRRVVVIGAGNTAVDAAIAAVRLGAETVTMVYRKGLQQISAFDSEYRHAVLESVHFEWHAQPVEILGCHRVEGIRLQRTQPQHSTSGSPAAPAAEWSLQADAVVLAIGQLPHAHIVEEFVQVNHGRVVIEAATGQTSNPKFFAGGDCTNGGREVVDAVADGKRAGRAMAALLAPESQGAHHAHA